MEIVVEDNLDTRLDLYLSKKLDYSRSKIVKMISDGTILVNNEIVKNSYTLKKEILYQ